MKRKLFALSCLFMLTLLCASIFAAEWRFDVVVHDGDRTTFSTLTLGTDNEGSDMYDPGLDVPTFATPTGAYAFFPLDDPGTPHITMLGTDIRNAEDDEIVWIVNHASDPSAEQREITWDIMTIPATDIGYFYIGSAFPTFDVEDWTVLTTIGSFMFDPGQYVAIKFMSESSIDVQPPTVTDYQPTGFGVLPDRDIEFIIYDDLAGVDVASIYVAVAGTDVSGDLDMTAITYGGFPGYQVLYDPPFDFDWGVEVCVDIWAQDLADPDPHAMVDTFIYCFQVSDEPPPDDIPPYTEDWSPADGEMGVRINTPISVKVKDGGVGVDDESIILEVNGADVTGDARIGAIDHPLSGNYLVTYEPAAPLPPNYWNEVYIYAEDLNGNPMEETITFRTGLGSEVDPWDGMLTVWSRLGTDTTFKNLFFGVGGDCEDGYDDCDVPVICLPGRACPYFMISDPAWPSIDKLQTDMRDNYLGTKYWRAAVNNPGDNMGAYWDGSMLPEWTYFIGVGTADVPPGEDGWYNMKLYDELPFMPGEIIWIKYFTDSIDINAPYVRMSEPEGGAAGVAVTEPVFIELCDMGSGVDQFSVEVFINEVDITSELEWGILAECGGYSLLYEHYDDPFDAYSSVCVRVSAADLSEPPNELDTTFCFSVSPGPIWDATIIYHEDDGMDENLYPLDFGTANGADAGCDAFDVGLPMCPPSGLCVYFPVDDPDCIFNKLTKDMRSRSQLMHSWIIGQQGADAGNDYWVTWNTTDMLPTEDDWHFDIGVAYPGSEPTTWYDMKVTDNLAVEVGQQIHINVYWDVERWDLCGSVSLEGETDYSGIDIYMISLEEETLATEMTDATGDFCFFDYYASTYEVCFHYEGYYDSCVTVDLDMDIDLADVMLNLLCYTLSGYVDVEGMTDDGGVQVTFTSPIHTEVAYTESDGYYEFDCLHEGDYSVNLHLAGYPDVDDMITVTGDMTSVDWFMAEGCFLLDGTVLLGGVPAAGATVVVAGVGTYTTDEDGYYFDSCVYADTFTVTASNDCYETEEELVEFVGPTTVDFNLDAVTVSIYGVASLEGDDDYAGILVCLDGDCITTRSDGEFEFTDLECGMDYTITASMECYVTYEMTLEGVTMDTEHNFELAHMPYVTDIFVEADTLPRPFVDDSLTMTIYWTEPTDCCDSIYIMYTMEDDFSDYVWDWEVAAVIPCGTGMGETGAIFSGMMPDVVFCITFVPFCDGEHCPWVNEYACAGVSATPDPNQVLIYDFDNGATPIDGMGVEEAMAAILDELCVSYTITTQDADIYGHDDAHPYELEDYDAVFIALGVQDANDAKIPENCLNALIDYMDARYPVYVEGPDFAADYSTGTETEAEFFDMFGVSFIDDGMAESADTFNVDMLYTPSPSWWTGRDLYIDYDNGTLADRFVDEIGSDGAEIILVDEEGKGYAAYIVSGYQAIYSACYVGAMTPMDASAARLYDEFLRKFGVEVPCPSVAEKRMDKVPTTFDLVQNYPNPFNPITTVEFSLPEEAKIDVSVYNIFGQKVMNLADGKRAAGVYQITWDGTDMDNELLPTGVYFCKFQTADYSKTVKMMFMK
ncbi:T9SS type A sorting domain-containing protein [bacterium]|nr:T9SS type A sorting domain-containing protein [bacterium]